MQALLVMCVDCTDKDLFIEAMMATRHRGCVAGRSKLCLGVCPSKALASTSLYLRVVTYLHREELDHLDCSCRVVTATTSLSQSPLRLVGYAHDRAEVICRSAMTAEQCRAIRDAGWDTVDEVLNFCSWSSAMHWIENFRPP